MTHAAQRVPADWSGVRRVLAVRTDNLGDVLMTSPALAAIKETLRVHLTLLTSPSGAALAPHLPCVDASLPARVPWAKQPGDAPSDDVGELARTLQKHRFDAAVIFTTYTQSALPAALLAMLAHIPRRLAHCRENPYDLLSHWVRDPEPTLVRHEVERQLALVAAIGCATANQRLRFRLRAADSAAVRRRLAAEGIDARRRYIVVHPGASAPSRRWPAERFGRAIELIARQMPIPVIVTGSADECDLIDRACSHAGAAPAVALAGAFALGELAALIANAALLICNNSGPAHLAAALGTPVVDLYALTNPQHTPWQTAARVLSHDVPCRNCFRSVCAQGHHACLRGVSATQVADAALDLLRASKGEQRVPDPTAVSA